MPLSNKAQVLLANQTHPVLLLGLQLLDALQQALFGALQVVGQPRDGDDVRLEVRSRHLDVDLPQGGGYTALDNDCCVCTACT